MGLRSLLRRLPGEIARLSSSYAIAAREHETLAPYPTLAVLLDSLGPPGKRSTPERKALIALLVRVYQTKPHTVWSTLLLHVFSPMLKKLRKELHGGDQDTRDGVLVEVIQESLRCVRTDDPRRIYLYVRQALRRGAFRTMKEVFAWQQVGFGTEADLEPDPRTEIEPPLIGVWLKGHGTRPEQAELLSRRSSTAEACGLWSTRGTRASTRPGRHGRSGASRSNANASWEPFAGSSRPKRPRPPSSRRVVQQGTPGHGRRTFLKKVCLLLACEMPLYRYGEASDERTSRPRVTRQVQKQRQRLVRTLRGGLQGESPSEQSSRRGTHQVTPGNARCIFLKKVCLLLAREMPLYR